MTRSPTSPKTPAVSFRALFHAWYAGVELPKIEGHHMHWHCVKVRQDELHVAAGLQHVIDDMTTRGVPLATKLGACRVLETYIRATHPAAARHVDLRGASIREQSAQGRADVLQLRAMTPDAMTDDELQDFIAAVREHKAAIDVLDEQAAQAMASRVAGRAEAMRRLA